MKRQLGNPRLLVFLIAIGLFNESHQIVTVFLSQLQYVRAGMNHMQISIAYILANALALLGVFSARLSNWLGQKMLGVGLLVLAAVCSLLLGLFPIPLISVLAVMVLRVCYSLMQPMQLELQNRMIAGKDRATALSVNAVVLDSLGIFLNLIYGRVAQIRLDLALYLGAMMCLAGVFLYGLSFAKEP